MSSGQAIVRLLRLRFIIASMRPAEIRIRLRTEVVPISAAPFFAEFMQIPDRGLPVPKNGPRPAPLSKVLLFTVFSLFFSLCPSVLPFPRTVRINYSI